MTYVNVILPLPLPGLFTYSLPESYDDIDITGFRVIVPFGNRKFYTAIVIECHHEKPKTFKTKEILSVLDDAPLTNPQQLSLWKWIASYYMSFPGDVFKASVPAAFRVESESVIISNPETENITLTDEQFSLLSTIKNLEPVNIHDLSKNWTGKGFFRIMKELLAFQCIMIREELSRSYKPLTEKWICLNPLHHHPDALSSLLDMLRKAPKQADFILKYLHITGMDEGKNLDFVPLHSLTADFSPAIYKALLSKNVLIEKDIEISRFSAEMSVAPSINPLNEQQSIALQQIKDVFSSKNVALLHGVTSSGKTEIYIHLIREVLDAGGRVLYLLPEIALTSQIINRLKKAFGSLVGVYHSKFNDAERAEVYKDVIIHKKFRIILGVRSSVLLPFDKDLSLIIVDEEHENTYKQFDPAPRYNARDVAVYLSHHMGSKVLLATATPSIESYYNTLTDKYGLVTLSSRYKNILLPEIIVVDTLLARKRKKMKSHFSVLLLEEINKALVNKEQVILFQNRRGFSTFMECSACGWIPYCKNCNVSLTYHKHNHSLICHYCGYSIKPTIPCASCGSKSLKSMGLGTEKIEDEMQIFFPGVRTARMDTDSTRNKHAYDTLIRNFENRQIDILIGTQMVTKGLDFNHVSLVGIINADSLLNFPDFRAFERSFQMLTQVSGRAGRASRRGKVIIQTSNPGNPIINQVLNNDFTTFFNTQLQERKNFNYPPFCRLISLTVKHKKPEILDNATFLLINEIKKIPGISVLGPHDPVVNKINLYFIKTILIKINDFSLLSKIKKHLFTINNRITSMEKFTQLMIINDVDPY